MDNIEKISMTQINRVASNLIPNLSGKSEAQSYLHQVGELYFNFLHHPSKRLSINLPVFDLPMMIDLLNYLFCIEVLVRFSNKGEICPEPGMAIFDYFGYKAADEYNRKKNNFALSLQFVHGDHLEFEKNTRIRKDRFLPVFAKGTIENAEASIFSAFSLFTAIAKEALFPYPIIIDLDADSLLLLHNNMPAIHLPYLIDVVNTSIFDDHDDRDRLLESLIEKQIDNVISVRYPYHSNIDPVITRVVATKSKMLDIKFSSRFFHQEIQGNDLVILPITLNENLKFLEDTLTNSYVVVDTHHSGDLFAAITNLKNSWSHAGLNIYQYPFPSRWLMMIHQGESLNFYLNLVEEDFPAVRGQLLLDLRATITMIYDLNWLEKYLSHTPGNTFLLPSTTGYTRLMQNMRAYLYSHFKVVKDIESYCSIGKDNQTVILLDGFNKVLISNIIFKENVKFNIVVPDFIFFAYQPFISYYVGKYIYDALLKGAREVFDPAYQNHLSAWSKFSNAALSIARANLAKYRDTYLLEEQTEENIISPEEDLMQGLFKNEMVEILSNTQAKSSTITIEISDVAGNQWSLKPNSLVLSQLEGQILKLRADELQVGQFFATVDDQIRVSQHEAIIEKLSRVSLNARQWKQHLFAEAEIRSNLFGDLKRMGLSVKEATFTEVYLDQEEQSGRMSLPRSRNDWQIVGDFLGIPDISSAWINHKGWASIYALRQVYSKVIMLVFEHYSNTQVNDEILVSQVNQLINTANEQHQDAKLQTQDAWQIIKTISSHIKFQEIKAIKYL